MAYINGKEILFSARLYEGKYTDKNTIDVSQRWGEMTIEIGGHGKYIFTIPRGLTWLEFCTKYPEYGFICNEEDDIVYLATGAEYGAYVYVDIEGAEYISYGSNVISDSISKYWIFDEQEYYKGDKITFTVGDLPLVAEYGMTWSEWVNTPYNTCGIYCGDLVYNAADCMIINSEHSEAFPSDEITPNENYSCR